MHLSLLDAYVSLLGFPSGLRKATDGRSRWLLVLCVTLMLFALLLGADGVFLTFVRVTHDRFVSCVAAVLALFVLRSMTRLVVSGTLIPLHYPEPGLAPSDEPAALWLALYGSSPPSTLDYRPSVAPTLLLSSITAFAAQPVADLVAARLFSVSHARHGAVLANVLLVAVVFGCFAARHALYPLLYPYLVVILRGEVDVIKRHLACRELVIAQAHTKHADAVIGSSEQRTCDSPLESLQQAIKQRVERRKLGAKASLADGSRWTDLFEHWTELRYRFAAPELRAPSSSPPTAKIIIDNNGRARVVIGKPGGSLSRYIARCYGRFRGQSTLAWRERRSMIRPARAFDIELFYLELRDLKSAQQAPDTVGPSTEQSGVGAPFFQAFHDVPGVWIEAESSADPATKEWARIELGLVEIRRWRVLRSRVIGETVYGDLVGEACFEWPPVRVPFLVPFLVAFLVTLILSCSITIALRVRLEVESRSVRTARRTVQTEDAQTSFDASARADTNEPTDSSARADTNEPTDSSVAEPIVAAERTSEQSADVVGDGERSSRLSECTAPSLRCHGRCVPPDDPANCGRCGRRCPAQHVCVERRCVVANQVSSVHGPRAARGRSRPQRQASSSAGSHRNNGRISFIDDESPVRADCGCRAVTRTPRSDVMLLSTALLALGLAQRRRSRSNRSST